MAIASSSKDDVIDIGKSSSISGNGKDKDMKTSSYNSFFRDNYLYSAVASFGKQVTEIKNTMYFGTLSVATEVHDKLNEWIDALKGKDPDPDNYFPYEHVVILDKIRKKNRPMFDKFIAAGVEMRSMKPEDRTPEKIRELMAPMIPTKAH